MDLRKKTEEKKSMFAQVFLDKEAKLSKKQWHYKLLKYTLGEKMIPTQNFCPYFWLTLFCMAAVSFVFIAKTILSILDYCLRKTCSFFSALNKLMIKYVAEPLENINIEAFAKKYDKLYMGYLYYYYRHNEVYEKNSKISKIISKDDIENNRKYFSTYEEKFAKWKELNPNWEITIKEYEEKLSLELKKRNEYYASIREKQKLAEIKRNERKALQAKRDIKIKNAMMTFGKWFGIIILVPTAFTILFYFCKYVYIFIKFIASSIISVPTTHWLSALKFLGYAILIVIGIIILFIVLKSIITFIASKLSKLDFEIEIKQDSKFIKCLRFILTVLYYVFCYPFIKAYNFLKMIFSGLFDGLRFFMIFFVNWKSNNCPGIIWEEDETKK